MAVRPHDEFVGYLVYCKKTDHIVKIYRRKKHGGINPRCPLCDSYAPITEFDNHIPLKEVDAEV